MTSGSVGSAQACISPKTNFGASDAYRELPRFIAILDARFGSSKVMRKTA